MKIDNAQISGSRLMFAIAFFLQSSALLTAFIAGITKQDTWISLALGILFSLPLIYVFKALMVLFPDKHFLEVLDTVYGPLLGKILGIAYLWYFVTLTGLNLRDLADFAKITVMTETPSLVLTLLCMLVVVWAVRHGLRVVTQYGPLFTFVEFSIVILTILLMANQMDIHNFLPVFSQPFFKYVHSTHLVLTIPFGELVVFLMCTPCVKFSQRNAARCWFGGVAMGMLTILAVQLRDISILGSAISMYTLPGLIVLRLVNLGQALSRMEILFSAALMMLLYFKIAVLTYASTIAAAHLFKTTAYKRLALIMGVLIVAYAPTLFQSSVEHTISAWETTPFIWTPFEILFPLITLIVAKLRKLPQKAGTAA